MIFEDETSFHDLHTLQVQARFNTTCSTLQDKTIHWN